MIEITRPQDLTRLRRIALDAQGLLKAQPFGVGMAGALAATKHLGYVQIDTISVVERAHHHVLFSRVPKFHTEMINQLLLKRDIFEYWSHAAAFLPIDDYRFSLPYKTAIKSGQTHWYKDPDTQLMQKLLAQIRAEGPLRSRDVEAKAPKRAGWWDWKPAKKALEQLYMQGDLMVSDREGFQKTYDLTERVLPDGINTTLPTTEEFAQHMLQQQLRCHGFVTLKGITYLRRSPVLRQAVKALVNEQVLAGALEKIKLPSSDVCLIEAGALERALPRLSQRLLILSPFDNAVIQRDRLRALFNFDYQIECYVPAPKRQYGYFCLPLLFQGIFVGRMDCKAHRKTAVLEIKAVYLELEGVDEALLKAFVEAIKRFCDFQGCESITLTQVIPKHLQAPLQRMLKD